MNMKNIVIKSLITKIIISTTMLLFVAIGISWWIHMRIYEAQLMDEVRERLETVLDTAESSILKSMRIGKTDDTQNILELVNSHMKEESVVRIFHPGGIIIKSTTLRETGKRITREKLAALGTGKREFLSRLNNGRSLTMAKPIKNIRECYLCHGEGDKNIGILEAEISLDAMYDKVGEARRLSNLSAITISLVLSAFIFLLLFWIVIKPISKLNRKMALAEKGDLTVRSGLVKGDELGKLGMSFDSMIEKLQEARAQLEKYHYQQLIRADRLASVGELASGIAHEIRNPLAGIAGAVQIFAREFKGDEKKSVILKEILQQIARLDKSVKDLLNYASPSMSELAMGNLNQIVEKSLFFVIQQPNAREIKFVKELDTSVPKILVDDKQIQQVLINMFLNALNSMSGEGMLRISTFKDSDDSLSIEIEDSGVGISEADMAKLFVPFYTSREDGTGLGLPISKRIVEQHGGNISIRSIVDKGTCIKITLPIKGTYKEPRIKDEEIKDTGS